MDRWLGTEELHRLVDAHRQDVRYAVLAVTHGESLGVEAPPAALVAYHGHVRQEAHLDLLDPLAGADLAAPSCQVEREPARAVAPHPGLGNPGKEPPDLVPEAHVGGRAGPRGVADRSLVDFEDPVHLVPPLDRLAAHHRQRDPGAAPGAAGQQAVQVLVQDRPDQGTLAAAAHSGHTDEALEWKLDPDLLQVVKPCLPDNQPGASTPRGCAGSAACVQQRVAKRGTEKLRGQRARAAHQLLHGAGAYQPSTAHPAPRSQVQDVLGPADRLLVVLDHDHGIALVLELFQRVEQPPVVPGVQTDGRLVQDVADAPEVGAQLRGQADPLRLTAAQGRGRPIQRQVAQTHPLQELKARTDLGEHVAGNLPFPADKLESPEETLRSFDRKSRQLTDRPAAEPHGSRLRSEPGPAALRAGSFRTFPPLVPPDFFACLFAVETRQQEARAVAVGAPAMLGVERKQPGVRLLEAAAAARAGPASREDRFGRCRGLRSGVSRSGLGS